MVPTSLTQHDFFVIQARKEELVPHLTEEEMGSERESYLPTVTQQMGVEPGPCD